MYNRGMITDLPYLVTTSYSPTAPVQEKARQVAEKLNVPMVDRDKQSLKSIYSRYNVSGIIVVSKIKVSFHSPAGEFFFHPAKSTMRIKEIKAGKTDQMIKAMDLKPGYSMIDCTLGLATDAIVSAYVTGVQGNVVGLESSPVISTLVEMGLKEYTKGKKEVIEAMRRVRVLNVHHDQYLARLVPNSFDVVYFDPMFRYPFKSADYPVNPLRPLADHTPLERETIEEALRVARLRVVMKERRNSKEFCRLGADTITGGRHSPIGYGVWFAGNEGRL